MADYSNSKFEITRLDNSIFKLMPFEGVELDIEDVQKMRSVYLELSKGEKFAVLLDAKYVFTTTEEARKLLASKEYTDKRFAAAFVTSSLANKIFGNFFIKFNKPASPTKLFTEESSALEWLEEQARKNK